MNSLNSAIPLDTDLLREDISCSVIQHLFDQDNGLESNISSPVTPQTQMDEVFLSSNLNPFSRLTEGFLGEALEDI